MATSGSILSIAACWLRNCSRRSMSAARSSMLIESGAAVYVNSFRTKYVHKKMLFGVLTDERHQHYFTDIEREAIRQSVPWTRQGRGNTDDPRRRRDRPAGFRASQPRARLC